MFQVVKRDGEIADFQMSKITAAIDKAFDAQRKSLQQGYDRSAGTSGYGRFPE